MPEECPNGRGNEGAVLSLCDSLKPDRVYLFPSCMKNNPEPIKNTEWRAEIIREKLAERNPEMKCIIMPLDIKDATDF